MPSGPKQARSERDVFADLEKLCAETGFIHAIAAFCLRDNVWRIRSKLTADEVLRHRNAKELTRTEINTLIGLVIKAGRKFNFPGTASIQSMMDRAEALLNELHHSLMEPIISAMSRALATGERDLNPFNSAAAIREPIFYGGDAAYDFQYLDLAEKKYASAEAWLRRVKGFDMAQATKFAQYIRATLPALLRRQLAKLATQHPSDWTVLPAFEFAVEEVASSTGLSLETVSAIVDAFCDASENPNRLFSGLSDFNAATAFPIIRTNDNNFILLQHYALLESMYESPFYWMIGDKQYRNTASADRGYFAESYTAERLRTVFGRSAVTENVRIAGPHGRVLGEIDVLVLFGTRAIVVQAKSKKLTIAARKGNDDAMRADFTGAIQESYNQARACASLLEKGVTLLDASDRVIDLPRSPEVVIPVCVVAEHYPALSFQTRQMLSHSENGKIVAPFVVDLFLVDTICEMLNSPLFLLSYIERRALFNDKIHANHELSVLGYHLRSNLWVDTKFDMIAMDEDLAADVDVAMTARRAGIPGRSTPRGILTETKRGVVGKLVAELEHSVEPAKFDLGMMLLTLDGTTLSNLGKGIEYAARLSRSDRKVHDFTISLGEGETGITVHATYEPQFIAMPALERHCERRKYVCKADTWFGLAVHPKTLRVQGGLAMTNPWERSDVLDAHTRGMRPDLRAGAKGVRDKSKFKELIARVGRNDPCWCGSGKKYKKCHLDGDGRAVRTLR